MNNERFPVAIIGSGNIGTDLMIKILRSAGPLTMAAMIGIDPASDGLARAKRLGVPPLRKASTGSSPCPISTTSGWCSTPPPPAHTRGTGRCCATPVYAFSTSPPQPSDRSASRWSTSRTTSTTRRTSIWSPVAARPPCRSSPLSTGRRSCPTPRSCVDLVQVGRPGHSGQYRRVHRNDLYRTQSRRRGAEKQNGDDPQSGRSADSDAQHGVLPR